MMRATRTAMMAMTIISSMSVNALRDGTGRRGERIGILRGKEREERAELGQKDRPSAPLDTLLRFPFNVAALMERSKEESENVRENTTTGKAFHVSTLGGS